MRIEEARSLLLELRRTQPGSGWRFTWAESLLGSAAEFEAAGLTRETNALLDTFQRWYQERKLPAQQAPLGKGIASPWCTEMLVKECDRLEADAVRRAPVLPHPERIALAKRVEEARKELQEGRPDVARRLLAQARQSLLARLQRAWRARAHVPAAQVPTGVYQPRRVGGGAVGPYNARQLVEDTLDMVAERDPIWVEDMLTLFNDLRSLVSRLQPPEQVSGKKK